MTQSDASGIDVDLDRLRLSGFGQKLHVRETGAGKDKRVAFLQRILRGCRAQQSDSARGVRISIRNGSFAEERFGYRTRRQFGQFQHLFPSTKTASPNEH